MPKFENDARKVVARLRHEGWMVEHGKEHDICRHPRMPGLRIVVPRHRRLSPGVGHDIAKRAGWI
jgi:predicted RNA binding protein YcfA (HicA-like mRNA interferase family)